MLFQNKKSLVITFTTLAIAGSFSIGGVVNAQEYRYPPSEIAQQAQPAVNNTPRAPVTAPPVRRTAPAYPVNRPMPYPAQRNFAPGMMPPPYGAPRNAPYGGPRGPYAGGPAPMPGARPMGPGGPAPMPGARPMRPGGPAPMTGAGPMRPGGPAPMTGAGPMGPGGPAPMPGARPMGPGGPAPMAGARPMGPGGPAPYGSPYNRGSQNSGPFSGNNPMDNFGFGPFNRDTAPWETWPFGGRDSLWNRKELPFKNQSPADWVNPGDPKEGLAIMWEDLISAPDELGEMPGGWYVPSISVPNPVDLEDQMEKASKEVPDLIRVYN